MRVVVLLSCFLVAGCSLPVDEFQAPDEAGDTEVTPRASDGGVTDARDRTPEQS
jgi:hypothetical protein